jgi:hypothetical protein
MSGFIRLCAGVSQYGKDGLEEISNFGFLRVDGENMMF